MSVNENQLQTQSTTFPELQLFLDSLDLSERSIGEYRRNVARFMAWIHAQNILKPTALDILAYKKHLQKKELSPKTINWYLSAVRQFFRWAEMSGLYPDVARSVGGLRIEPGSSKDPLTVAQIRTVLDGCESLRERALLTLLFTTGLRTIEAVRADYGDLRTVYDQRSDCDKVILAVHGKGHTSADDFVVIPPLTAEALQDYLDTRIGLKATDPLFAGEGNRNRGRLSTRTIRAIVVDAFTRAGVKTPRISVHSTRHSAVTIALLNGASVQEAQEFARHKSITTTQVYAHNLSKLSAGTAESVENALFGSRSNHAINHGKQNEKKD
jgi:integrase/recombinase XerD